MVIMLTNLCRLQKRTPVTSGYQKQLFVQTQAHDVKIEKVPRVLHVAVNDLRESKSDTKALRKTK